MSRYNNIAGRIVKVRKLGAKLNFLELSSNGHITECIYAVSNDEDSCDLKRGDYLVAQGCLQDKPQKAQRIANKLSQEFAIHAVLSHFRPVENSAFLEESLDRKRIESLRARSIANDIVPSFFINRGFTHVTSPTIVGDWAESDTGPFPVKFYEHDKAYLTLSTMVHHQMMQTMGYHNIFEMPKLFRKNTLASGKKLSEFTNIVMGQTEAQIGDLIDNFSDMIIGLHDKYLNADFKNIRCPDTIHFDRIDHDSLLKKSGIDSYKGHQFPQTVRHYINKNFSSFLWVTGFPQHTRPFFVKSHEGKCDDAQLWFQGKNFLAAGGVREIDPDIVLKKIIAEGKDPIRYEFYLSALKMGAPAMANMDMGVERFLGNFFDGTKSADFTFFPRYEGRLVP